MKVPKQLVDGDRVAVVAPSGRVQAERLEIGIEHLRRWGLEVEVMPSVLAGHDRLDYLAADDKARAEDLRSAWLDEQFAAVLCARGGYGVQRMLEYVDFDELAAVPKWFVGFNLLAPAGARTVVDGVAEGPLRGGNLALLAASIGTATYARPKGVVVLEDVSEHGYRVDRLLTQLLRSGWFDEVTGLVMGDFSDTEDEIDDVVRERLEPLGLPMVDGAAIGHENVNLAVPLGLPVRLDATAATLTPLFS